MNKEEFALFQKICAVANTDAIETWTISDIFKGSSSYFNSIKIDTNRPKTRDEIKFPDPTIIDLRGQSTSFSELEKHMGLEIEVNQYDTWVAGFKSELVNNSWENVWMQFSPGGWSYVGTHSSTAKGALLDLAKKLSHQTIARQSVFDGYCYHSRIVKLGQLYMDKTYK